jgi:hypothetical protein
VHLQPRTTISTVCFAGAMAAKIIEVPREALGTWYFAFMKVEEAVSAISRETGTCRRP